MVRIFRSIRALTAASLRWVVPNVVWRNGYVDYIIMGAESVVTAYTKVVERGTGTVTDSMTMGTVRIVVITKCCNNAGLLRRRLALVRRLIVLQLVPLMVVI